MLRKSTEVKGELERLHAEADLLLTQKAAEITEMNKVVEDAEQRLVTLKAQLAAKIKQVQTEDASEDSDDDHQQFELDLQELKSQQQQEIDAIVQDHAAQLKAITDTFQISIQESEKWVDVHATSVRTEKIVQLDQARKQFDDLRGSKADAQLSATQSRIKIGQQTKSASFMNEQRVRLLESRISEITASAREEARDIKLKINECLLSIELREREHAAQIASYEAEGISRQAQYDVHLKQMEEQFTTERKRLEQAITAETAKLKSVKKVAKQLETTQRKWKQLSTQGIEKLRATLRQVRGQSGKGFEQTRESVSRIGQCDRRRREVAQEIAVVDQEIAELSDENSALRGQLEKLDQSVYGRQGTQ
jgi:hypothetical protein